MKTAVKVAGVLSILAGLRSLVQADASGFVMFCTLGAGLLVEPRPGGGGYGVKWLLIIAAFALALARIV